VEATTKAEEEDSPAPGGTLPDTITSRWRGGGGEETVSRAPR
jgi:hypothetical protein